MRLLIIGLLAASLASCGGQDESPQDALRQWVTKAQAAAEAGDRSALMGMLSEHYADARGNDYKAVDQMLRYIFLRQDKVVLISKIDEISVSGETAALVKLGVGMAGANGGRLGFSADAYRFELELEHDGDEWLLIAARWGELGQNLR
jgi:hypothetical protein